MDWGPNKRCEYRVTLTSFVVLFRRDESPEVITILRFIVRDTKKDRSENFSDADNVFIGGFSRDGNEDFLGTLEAHYNLS